LIAAEISPRRAGFSAGFDSRQAPAVRILSRGLTSRGERKMCGRFVDPNLRDTEVDMSQIKLDPFGARFNVKPTETVVILAKSSLIAMEARCGLMPAIITAPTIRLAVETSPSLEPSTAA